MILRTLRLTLLAVTAVAALASVAAAQHTKDGTFYFEGPATAEGTLDIKLVVRGQDCSAAGIHLSSVVYDGAVGGNPTTATEIRNEAHSLMASLPAGYTATMVTLSGNPGIQISTTVHQPFFDICVNGTKILGSGIAASHSENGVTVTGDDKTKVGVSTPGASPLVMALIALLVAVSGVFMIRRRAEA